MINIKNLRIRLLGARVLVLLLLLLGFAYTTLTSLDNAYIASLEATLNTALKDMKHDYQEDSSKPFSFSEIKEEFDIPILYAQIVAYNSLSNEPAILARSNDLGEHTLHIPQNIIQKIFENPNESAFFYNPSMKVDDKNVYTGTIFLAQNEFQMLFLQCALPYNTNTPQAQEMKKMLLFWLPCFFIIILIIANRLITRSFASVSAVTQHVKSMYGKKEYTVIPQSHVAREIDDLIATFNTLLNELHHAYTQVKQFGQNASHELKTPLTIIKGEIDVGLRKERTPKEYVQILEKVGREVATLHEVIEKILFLSNTSKNDMRKHFHELYMDEILLEAIDEKRSLAEQKQIALSLDTLEPQNLRGNAALLKIAITNLIDNAIKYSPAHSTIHIALKEHELSIRDEGMGMSEEEMEHIFEQFYRTKESQESTKGSGLGLCIVKNILDLHDLTIRVQSDKKQGTDVSIFF